MDKCVLGEFVGFTLIYEENLFGGIWFWCFLRLWAIIHVEVGRRGGTRVHIWGNLRVLGV
jgi:hypothetical protein